MPWSSDDAHKYKKGLSGEQARKWAKIANSALEQYGDEGRAIKVANSKVSKAIAQDTYVEVFAKALDAGFNDERSHKIAWAAIEKHLPGKHDQKDHGRKKSKGQRAKARAKEFGRRSVGPEGRSKVLQAAADVVGSSLYASKSASDFINRLMWSIKLEDMAKKEREKIGKADGDPAKKLAEKIDAAKADTEEKLKRVLEANKDLVVQAVDAADPVSKKETSIATSDEAETYVEFSKVDEDKRQVFGWAIVAKDEHGNEVIDLQGDMVTPDEVEKAAYDYVVHSRDGGEMHVRKGVSRMIESMVISPDKLDAMGIVSKDANVSVPIGWWVGFEVTDEGVWDGVKKGRYTGFSIHGMGKRKSIGKRSDIEKQQRLRKRAQDLLGEAVMRGDDEAVEQLTKHLIGKHLEGEHDQQKHAGDRRKRIEDLGEDEQGQRSVLTLMDGEPMIERYIGDNPWKPTSASQGLLGLTWDKESDPEGRSWARELLGRAKENRDALREGKPLKYRSR